MADCASAEQTHAIQNTPHNTVKLLNGSANNDRTLCNDLKTRGEKEVGQTSRGDVQLYCGGKVAPDGSRALECGPQDSATKCEAGKSRIAWRVIGSPPEIQQGQWRMPRMGFCLWILFLSNLLWVRKYYTKVRKYMAEEHNHERSTRLSLEVSRLPLRAVHCMCATLRLNL